MIDYSIFIKVIIGLAMFKIGLTNNPDLVQDNFRDFITITSIPFIMCYLLDNFIKLSKELYVSK